MPTSAEPVKEYWFIEELPSDYKCPVMLEVLLEPHQTACCGQHLSQDATVRIKKEKGECPLCKDPNFQTTEDKYFRRKVYELGVFCPNKRRGCEWEGELGDLDHHVDMCIKYTRWGNFLAMAMLYTDGEYYYVVISELQSVWRDSVSHIHAHTCLLFTHSVESDKSQPECSQRQRRRKVCVNITHSMGTYIHVHACTYYWGSIWFRNTLIGIITITVLASCALC